MAGFPEPGPRIFLTSMAEDVVQLAAWNPLCTDSSQSPDRRPTGSFTFWISQVPLFSLSLFNPPTNHGAYLNSTWFPFPPFYQLCPSRRYWNRRPYCLWRSRTLYPAACCDRRGCGAARACHWAFVPCALPSNTLADMQY